MYGLIRFGMKRLRYETWPQFGIQITVRCGTVAVRNSAAVRNHVGVRTGTIPPPRSGPPCKTVIYVPKYAQTQSTINNKKQQNHIKSK